MNLKDLNEPVCNYALFADFSAGQTFHIRSSDKTSHYFNYHSLNCCLHSAKSDAELIIVVGRCTVIFLLFSFLLGVVRVSAKKTWQWILPLTVNINL